MTLRQSYRQQDDPEFAAALRRMRMRCLTQADLDMLNARVVAPHSAPQACAPTDRCRMVCFTNAERYGVTRRLNQRLCDALVGAAARSAEAPPPTVGRAFVAVDARIRRSNQNKHAPLGDAVEALIRNGVKGDRSLGDRPPTLFLAPGCPLTLTDNTCVQRSVRACVHVCMRPRVCTCAVPRARVTRRAGSADSHVYTLAHTHLPPARSAPSIGLANGSPVSFHALKLKPDAAPQWRYQPRLRRFCWSLYASDVLHMVVKHDNPAFASTPVCDAVEPGFALVKPTLHRTQLLASAFPGLPPMAVNSTTVVVQALPAVAGYAATVWKWQGATLSSMYARCSARCVCHLRPSLHPPSVGPASRAPRSPARACGCCLSQLRRALARPRGRQQAAGHLRHAVTRAYAHRAPARGAVATVGRVRGRGRRRVGPLRRHM